MSSELRHEKAPSLPECIDREKLEQRILDIDAWALREGLTVKYVSGMLALRGNPERGWPEVFLVNGSSKGIPKEFWQFPGGHVHPEDGNDHVRTLQRELNEELGVALPEKIAYVGTYIPKPKEGVKEVYAIHAFTMPIPDWETNTMTLGSDVSQFVWTDDPLRKEDGEARILTEQVDFILRRVIGYSGPNSKNTCQDDAYDGTPASLAEMIRECKQAESVPAES
jgi:ADP-ribose pyrophosphatase YjhB (NUDIX family)